MKFLSDIRLLLIGLWLGAACFFSFAVAPSAFSVLENRELAGSVVSRTLMIVNLSGLVVGLILLLSSFIKREGIAPFRVWMERFLLVLFTLACAVGQFVIALWMSFIRTQLGKPIEEAAADDPLRMQFNNLHQYSVWILMGAMIGALVLFFLIGKRSEKNLTADTKDEFKF
jgi:MFS family permease